MKKPLPQLGQIIRFDYLWHDEARRGRIEGEKERPCAVIVAISQSGKEPRVLVAPITHSPPLDARDAIEIPGTFKNMTGLDEERSWLTIAELNEVAWSDAGIVPARRGQWLYGHLPRGLAQKALDAIRERLANRALKMTRRTEA